MHILKKFLIVITVLTLIMLGDISTYAEVEAFTDLQNDGFVQGVGDSFDVEDAKNDLYASFPVDEYGGFIYPDDYAGCYIDNSTLYILHTETDIDRYMDLYSKYGCVRFKQVNYSKNELNEISKEYISSNNLVAYSSYIDERENIAVISTNIETYGNILNSKTRQALPLQFKIGEPLTFMSSTTVYGGTKIHNRKYASTLGAVAINSTDMNNIKYYAITCGHSYSVGDVIYVGEGSIFDKRIGVVTKVNFEAGDYGDYSLIKLDSDINITTLSYFNSTTKVKLVGAHLATNGDNVFKYGSFGGLASGTVVGTDCTVWIQNDDGTLGYYIQDLTAVYFDNVNCTSGDSGAPVYYYDDGYRLSGFVSCGELSGEGQLMYMTPTYRILGCGINYAE